jgi:hypothetical protein
MIFIISSCGCRFFLRSPRRPIRATVLAISFFRPLDRGGAICLEHEHRFRRPPGGVHASCPNDSIAFRTSAHSESATEGSSCRIPVAQPVSDVPADAQFDNLYLEPPASIDPIACLRLGHSASCRATTSSRRRQCTSTKQEIITDKFGSYTLYVLTSQALFLEVSSPKSGRHRSPGRFTFRARPTIDSSMRRLNTSIDLPTADQKDRP